MATLECVFDTAWFGVIVSLPVCWRFSNIWGWFVHTGELCVRYGAYKWLPAKENWGGSRQLKSKIWTNLIQNWIKSSFTSNIYPLLYISRKPWIFCTPLFITLSGCLKRESRTFINVLLNVLPRKTFWIMSKNVCTSAAWWHKRQFKCIAATKLYFIYKKSFYFALQLQTKNL